MVHDGEMDGQTDGRIEKVTYIDVGAPGLGMIVGDSLHPHYHLCKSRKRKLGRVMKSLPKGKAACVDITRANL